MTEPTYEVNYEKISSLSIADLTGLMLLIKSKSQDYEQNQQYLLFEMEFFKRINDIIIF